MKPRYGSQAPIPRLVIKHLPCPPFLYRRSNARQRTGSTMRTCAAHALRARLLRATAGQDRAAPPELVKREGGLVAWLGWYVHKAIWVGSVSGATPPSIGGAGLGRPTGVKRRSCAELAALHSALQSIARRDVLLHRHGVGNTLA